MIYTLYTRQGPTCKNINIYIKNKKIKTDFLNAFSLSLYVVIMVVVCGFK